MSETVKLHFVDTETTGLIDNGYPDAEITEIAIVTWQEGNTEVLLHSDVRIKKAPPANLSKYNKSWDVARNAQADSFGIAEATFLQETLAGAYICGSNPGFDKRMIAAECFRTGQPAPTWSHRGVNTCDMGMMLWIIGETEGAGLGHLTEYFGIEHAAHTALGDCYAAIKVWECFFDLFIHRPRELEKVMRDFADGRAQGQVQARAAKVLADLDAPF